MKLARRIFRLALACALSAIVGNALQLLQKISTEARAGHPQVDVAQINRAWVRVAHQQAGQEENVF